MSTLVADASALVGLSIVADGDPDPLALCLARYEVAVPTKVIEELEDIASYDDVHGQAATAVLNRAETLEAESVDLDADFPLENGENAAVALANERGAALLLYDEFTQLGLIHASLADTRLATTPTLLSVFVRAGQLSAADARTLLEDISDARSWDGNSYVQRARSLLEESQTLRRRRPTLSALSETRSESRSSAAVYPPQPGDGRLSWALAIHPCRRQRLSTTRTAPKHRSTTATTAPTKCGLLLKNGPPISQS